MSSVFFSYAFHNDPDEQLNSQFYSEIQKALLAAELDVDTYSYSVDNTWNEKPSDDANASAIIDRINKADFYVSEMTYPSQTMGFLLGYALQKGKPSLYLYTENGYGRPNVPVLGNPSRLLTIKGYNEDTLEDIIRKFIKRAKRQLRSDRITFVSSKEINAYVNWKSVYTGLSKGEVIRTILEEAIDTDPDYKN